MTVFQSIYLTLLLAVLLSTGISGRRVVVTERRTRRSSSASAYASASSSSSSTVTTYTKTKTVVKNPAPPPKNATQRIREAILNGDVEEISSILSNETNIAHLAHGFKFPEEKREDYLIVTLERRTDPDVIALKGMAKAAVDHDIAQKLTDVFVHAIYGADFDVNVCPEEPKSTYSKTVNESRTVTTTTYGYKKITNASGTYTIYDAPETETSFWENSYTTDGLDLEIEEEAVASLEAESYEEEAECYTKEEIERIRNQLFEDFSDEKLMKDIVKTHPKPKRGRGVHRLLLVVGTPVSSWLCSECWKPKFCNKNVYWCPQ